MSKLLRMYSKVNGLNSGESVRKFSLCLFKDVDI